MQETLDAVTAHQGCKHCHSVRHAPAIGAGACHHPLTCTSHHSCLLTHRAPQQACHFAAAAARNGLRLQHKQVSARTHSSLCSASFSWCRQGIMNPQSRAALRFAPEARGPHCDRSAHTAAEASRPAHGGAPHRKISKQASWWHAARHSHAASSAAPTCVAAAVLQADSRADRIARTARGGSYLPSCASRSSMPDFTSLYPCRGHCVVLVRPSLPRRAARKLCSPKAQRAAPGPTPSATESRLQALRGGRTA
jgi:hypothetical protein